MTPTDRRLERLQQAYLRLWDALPQPRNGSIRLISIYVSRPKVPAPLANNEPYRVMREALR